MVEDMASTMMEDFCLHINMKISNIKKSFQLKKIGEEKCLKLLVRKIGKDMILLNDLLDKMETEVNQQEKLKNLLQELQQAAERDLNEARHLLEHVPPHLPKPTQNCVTVPTVKHEEQTKMAEPEPAKKPAKEKRVIKEIPLITAEEFEAVPAYLKGRLVYDQINAVVQEINKAVVDKYKIMHRPLKSMSFAVRNLYDRFIQEETKDTKGEFFIVEADIKAFTQLKVDKRFHSILSILRHCHRVREVRGSNLVRYIIC
ncbi:spindle and kinetochore-associated protein 1-like [Neopelma chrysocephalum]|uniref:spindle and kinetochore-associated protein 1-like n=1 Tax=Neopelma chrysocephalum TaxID=114329 RepID=UPI000FCD46D5|nr:spindle and kinetochore-associated protein 1-like [Neopelma chrysocephalum]XP_027564039.1 spindle and kinetochore-associated protein 1-like [Neopelma chrysocephalum]XP_027564040.1 spindle and kinetochore-associated protein 1-like [Neopelma chrysocephalum]